MSASLLSNEVMRYTFHVNSQKRSAGTNTNLTLNFSQIINRLSREGQFVVQVTSVGIPFSFYQIDTTSNLNVLPVYLKNALDVSGRNTTITITPGNYTAYTLITELNSKLTTACAQTGIVGFTPFVPVFNTYYTPSSGFITFVLTSPVGCEISLLFSTNTTTGLLGNFFGVGQTDVVMTTTTTPSSTIPCVLNPINYLFLRSSLKQYRNREFVVLTDDVSDILMKIPISTSQGTWIQFNEVSEPIYIIDNSIPSINFYLTNNLTYDPINLQQIPWSFSFSITEIIRPDYQSISTTLAQNYMMRPSSDEVKRLEEERMAIMEKLRVYQKKLEFKDKEAGAEDKKTEEKKTGAEEAKDNTATYASESHQSAFETIQYASVFDFPPARPEEPEKESPQ